MLAGPTPGIAPEDQEAIFEEFRQVGTADKKVEGSGLGLALHASSSSCMAVGSG
jgi:K+-sensing histidine kinase KdpD